MATFVAVSLIVIVVGLSVYAFHRQSLDDDESSDDLHPARKKQDTDLKILDIKLDPPPGSTLMAHEKIKVTIKYRYSKPSKQLLFWAYGIANGNGRYDPSVDTLRPGTGTVTRHFSMQEPGEVSAVRIAAADLQSRNIFRRTYPFKFTYVPNPEMDFLENDGESPKIIGIRFDPPYPATLKIGSEINVYIDHEVQSKKGLDLWVRPLVSGDATHESSYAKINGNGTARRSFVVASRCSLKQVHILMCNVTGHDVLSEAIEVNYEFI